MIATHQYRADIDGLRAIAILLVCVFHFGLLPMGDAGFIGVDVFFVISGYLITRIITGALETGQFSLTDFYYRRVRRLYPALLVTLLLYLAVAYVVFLPRLFEELAWEAFFSSIYGINFYLWRSVDYFGFHAHGKPLLHMWSLAVEEQFYLIYPLALMALWKWARSWLLTVLILAVLGSFALGWIASTWKPQAAFYLLPTRAWELGAGGVLAIVSQRWALPGWVIRSAGLVAVFLLGVALVIHRPDMPFPGWFAALPVLSAAFFILSGQIPAAPVTRVLSSTPMVFFGKISYPLYLVHWPVKILLQDVLAEMTWAASLLGFVGSILLATLIYLYVETPIRSGRFLVSARKFLSVTGISQALVLCLSLAGMWSNGIPQRFDRNVQDILAFEADMPKEFSRCAFTSGGVQSDCLIGDRDAAPSRMVVGDSHAYALAGAMDLFLQRRGEAAILSFGYGCLPVRTAGRGDCLAFTSHAFDIAETLPVKEVVIASSWKQPYDGDGTHFNGQMLKGAARMSAFEDGLTQTVTRLQAAGKSVLLVEPMYWALHPVPPAMARRELFDADWPLDIPRAEYDATFSHLMALFDSLEGVRRLSLIDDLCRDGVCPAIWQDGPVFTDSTHMARRMQEYFADVLATYWPG